jgi:regulator of sigma E protease
MIITGLAFIVTLGVLIFVHELGHFLAAKWAGIHVHRFSLGLGSPIPGLSFTRGETEYCIAWFPLGGYVKMATREEEAASSALEGATPATPVAPEAYYEAKPVWQRMIVILAGVTMNALFAWLAFSGLAWRNGLAVDPETRLGVVVPDSLPPSTLPMLDVPAGTRITAINGHTVRSWNDVTELTASAAGDSLAYEFEGRPPVVLPIHHDDLDARFRLTLALQAWLAPVVGEVVADAPAAAAGLQAGDTILVAGGTPVSQWYELVSLIEGSPDQPLPLEVGRAAGRVAITVTPRGEILTVGRERRTVGRIGVQVARELERKDLNLAQALGHGLALTGATSIQIFRTVRGMFTGRVSAREVGGPILIGQQAGMAARGGWESLLAFMALISVNLAILNLLPIPVLDGGQFLFLLAEGLYRRPLPLKLRERLTAVGVALLLMLMVLVFWNDISRLVAGGLGG